MSLVVVTKSSALKNIVHATALELGETVFFLDANSAITHAGGDPTALLIVETEGLTPKQLRALGSLPSTLVTISHFTGMYRPENVTLMIRLIRQNIRLHLQGPPARPT